MMRRRPPSLKVSGHKKVTFHLDQLVYFFRREHDLLQSTFEFQCEMIESGVRRWGTGVMCGHTEIDFGSLEAAAEAALVHIQEMHVAAGGTRLPKGRGKERRERLRDEWNARRIQERRIGMEIINGHG